MIIYWTFWIFSLVCVVFVYPFMWLVIKHSLVPFTLASKNPNLSRIRVFRSPKHSKKNESKNPPPQRDFLKLRRNAHYTCTVKGREKSLMRTTYQNTSMRFGVFSCMHALFVPKNPNVMGFSGSVNGTTTKPGFWILFFANVNGPSVILLHFSPFWHMIPFFL